ncbi:MAG: hypothetical protein E7037_05220 [Verrucomicrobia bacterium]|nr:hypothetical protein [Verrucomicrobiota bacterium]
MNRYFLFLLVTIAFAICGCVSNYYEEYYVANASAGTEYEKVDDVSLRFSSSPDEDFEEELFALIEDGYELVGESAFSAVHCPWVCAIEQAKDVGATLVVFREKFHRSKVVKRTAYVSSTTYSYTSGTVSGYSSTGGYVSGTYSGHTGNTTLHAVPYSQEADYYNQYGFFFRKRKFDGNFYGVILAFPQFLPGDSDSDEITVHIAAVVKGTRAREDGLSRGEIVDKINGIPIRTKKDIKPFAAGRENIVSVSVRKEQK